MAPCVPVDCRVGAGGFLALGHGTANLRPLDHVAALEWVRDNIHRARKSIRR